MNRNPLQHLLNNHMVRMGGWKPTTVENIELRTGRRRSSSTTHAQVRMQKRSGKKISNHSDAAGNNKEKKQDKPIIPVLPFSRASTKKVEPKKYLSSVPPRRSKRLREKALPSSGKCVNLTNEAKLRVQKKKKTKYSVKESNKPKSTLSVSQEALEEYSSFRNVDVIRDSNTLFRAFAHQLYGKQELHSVIRDRCCRFLELYRGKFQLAVDTAMYNNDFQEYVNAMRMTQVKGGKLEITAVSELYNRPVKIYPYHGLPDPVLSSSLCNAESSPLRLSIDSYNFYHSVVTDDHKKKIFACDAGVFEDSRLFHHAMKVERNFEIYKVPDDGNCLFSAFAHQVYGDSRYHELIREKCCNYMSLYETRFAGFIDVETHYVNFKHYLDKMRSLGQWGGNLEITALSELYQRPVEVYDQQTTPRNIFSNSVNYDNNLGPIRITYKNGNHYNSVVSEEHGDMLIDTDSAGTFEDAVLMSLGYQNEET